MRFQRRRSEFIALMKYNVLLCVAVSFLLSGCSAIDPKEDIPTYVQIDSVDFVINNSLKEGSASHNIKTAWVYYNNNSIGVFDLPCRVPVITDGEEGVFSFAPGITLNGLQDLQPRYEFYQFDTLLLKTSPGKVINFTPMIGYVNTATFQYKEDFEVGNTFEEYQGLIGDTAIVRTTDPSLIIEGGGSGLIRLDANTPTSENITKSKFSIKPGESFIEIDYKCSVPFEIGLYNTLSSQVDVHEYIAGVKAKEEWNKIYIELGSYTGKYPGTNYRVMIKAALPEGQSQGYVILDNIKVISF